MNGWMQIELYFLDFKKNNFVWSVLIIFDNESMICHVFKCLTKAKWNIYTATLLLSLPVTSGCHNLQKINILRTLFLTSVAYLCSVITTVLFN